MKQKNFLFWIFKKLRLFKAVFYFSEAFSDFCTIFAKSKNGRSA